MLMNWDFLFALLKIMEFPTAYIHGLLSVCLLLVIPLSLMVDWNVASEELKVIRQGDPISYYK